MKFKATLLHKKGSQAYYHGSSKHLEIGTILRPSADYEQRWGYNWWYQALERYRPKDMLSHRNSVFMCDNSNDIDAAGGGTEWVFIVVPLGKVERHDMNWGSRVEGALEEHNITDDVIADLCHNYWDGIPTEDPLWEYLTPQAEVVDVEKY